MQSPRSPARADQFMLSFPEGMRARLKADAALNRRSLNSEIIFRLEQYEQEKSAARTAIPPRYEHAETLTGNSNDYANE